MLAAAVRPDEEQRLGALRALGILDTPEEQAYDRLTELAARLCGAPIALVSLVDADRQWFKSHHGLQARQTGRVESFCAHAVASGEALLVPDVQFDERFYDNPLVTGDPHIRSYAGVPLRSRDGHALGTLCVIDRRVLQLTDEQLSTLKLLAQQVEVLLELQAMRQGLDEREALLRNQHELLEGTQEVSDSILWEWDLRTGLMRHWRDYSAMFGYAPTVGDSDIKAWIGRTHPDDGESAWAKIMAHLKGQTDRYEALYRQRHANGNWIWIHSRGRVIERDRDGRALRMVGIALNVDREKRLEVELADANRELRAQVERTEAMARAKSQFLANVAHEIRTPLNGIVGAAQLALLNDDPQQQRADVGVVHSAAQNLLDLVNRVLDMSRLEAGALTLEALPFSPAQLVHEVQRQFSSQAVQAGLRLETQVDDDVPVAVIGDALRLRQVLSNLIGNALKFTERGSVTVRLTHDAPPSDGYCALRLTVEDTGIGMTEAQMDRLFAPFEQADASIARRFGGTGLGLHISQQLVARMGGRIAGFSQPQQGSRFVVEVRLPLAPQGFVPEAESAKRAAAPEVAAVALATEIGESAKGLQGLKVLVVDDNPMNRVVAQRFLAQAGVQCEAAESAAEAFSALERTIFDAVLMDLYMPELNGDQATMQIRSRWPDLPVIAVSASVTVEEAQRCRDCGMNEFLPKPIDPVRLLEVLAQLCLRA